MSDKRPDSRQTPADAAAVSTGAGQALRKRAEEQAQHMEPTARSAQTPRHQAEALRASNTELERFNRAMIGREMRMIELKREINELCRRLGEPARHAGPLPAERAPGVGQTPAEPDGGGP
jgi:hypothetical protein